MRLRQTPTPSLNKFSSRTRLILPRPLCPNQHATVFSVILKPELRKSPVLSVASARQQATSEGREEGRKVQVPQSLRRQQTLRCEKEDGRHKPKPSHMNLHTYMSIRVHHATRIIIHPGSLKPVSIIGVRLITDSVSMADSGQLRSPQSPSTPFVTCNGTCAPVR